MSYILKTFVYIHIFFFSGKRVNMITVTFCPPQNRRPIEFLILKIRGVFPGGVMVKNLPANAGDTSSSPGPGRFHMLQSS